MLWKRRWLRIIRRFLKEELQSNQVKIPFINVNPFVASVTCSRYQIHSNCKWSVNFWLQVLVYDEMEDISVDEISIYTFSNSRKLSRQKFHNELACVFTAHSGKKADWNQQQLKDGGVLANRNSANHPYCFLSNHKKVQILAFLHLVCKRNVSCPPPENRL